MKVAISYKTKQRDKILDCLIQNKAGHMTADRLMEMLNADNALVGRTTIYRYLDKLVSQGIVRKYLLEGNKSASYQYMEQVGVCSEHYHLKCTDCGQITHLDCDYLEDVDYHILNHHNFTVDHSKTVLYGKCGSCTQKPKGDQG